MPLPVLPPSPADNAKLITRVEQLERQFRALDLLPQDQIIDLVTFSYPGTLSTGVESPPWYPRDSITSITFVTVRVSRLTTGASDLLIDVKVNGSTITTVTLAAGELTAVDSSTSIIVPADEPLTVTVNDAGDAENATVELF